MNYKRLITTLTALLILIPNVLGAVPGPSFNIDSFFSFIKNVLSNIFSIFDMAWIGNNMTGFLKFLLWVTVFSIFYGVGQGVFSANKNIENSYSRKLALIISLVLATGTTLAVPASLIATIFSTYATVIVFIFMMGAIYLIIKVIYGKRLKQIASGRGLHVLRIFGLLLCWIILALISSAFDSLSTSITTFQYILPLLFVKTNVGFNKNGFS